MPKYSAMSLEELTRPGGYDCACGKHHAVDLPWLRIGLFTSKYGERVKVYTMGEFSKEICGGPHASNTADLKSFKIKKEESSSAGVRRIKAVIGQ